MSAAAFEMQPLSVSDDLDDLDKAKKIIQKYADMGDQNFIMLNKLVKGEIKKPELRFVEVVNRLTPDEKTLMLRVAQQLQVSQDYDNEKDYPFLESAVLGGKKRSKKRSNMRSKKNRGRRTTSHRRRSRARR